MTCSKSYALGRWRGAMNKPRPVLLAEIVCRASYEEGHDAGRAERMERDAARRGKGRSPSWTR